jgi:hypothetical protein
MRFHVSSAPVAPVECLDEIYGAQISKEDFKGRATTMEKGGCWRLLTLFRPWSSDLGIRKVQPGSPSSDAAASHDATVILIRPLGEDVWHCAAPPTLGRGWRPQGCGGGGEGRGSLEIDAGFPPPAYWRLFCSHGQRKREGVKKSTLIGLHAPSTKQGRDGRGVSTLFDRRRPLLRQPPRRRSP